MPFFFSERLPVPALKSYCVISVIIFGASLTYLKNIYDINKDDHNEESSLNSSASTSTTSSNQEQDVLDFLLSEPFILWSFVNMAFCFLFMFGKIIQKIILGDLRVTEEQHLQDRFWNFIFYKTIFIFGVVNAQTLHDVLCWVAWFSMLGLLNIFNQLCKDRYEHYTSSPNTPKATHVKLLCLITSIMLSSFVLSLFAIKYGVAFGWNQFMFMLAECVILGVKSLHTIFKYIFHLKNLLQTGMWDRKAKMVYYTDFILKFLVHTFDLAFHFHMLIWSNVFLSMASLVLYWNIQSIFGDLKKMFKKHRIYRKILKSVDTRFPLASMEELENFEDHCAICWDNMESARKLPCSHLFHHGCLCSWLEQDVSCPTCRRSLAVDVGIPQGVNEQTPLDEINPDDLQEIAAENRVENNGGGLRNYFFYLDGQQIANWFPSLSIEVFHGRVDGTENQQIDEMAQQLFSMFPNISRDAIIEDLQRSNSVEATADNILEGSLPTATVEESPVPTITAPDERPQQITNSVVATGNESEQVSDCESFVEDSSGTEDSSTAYARSEADAGVLRRRIVPLATSNARRRGMKRSRPSTSSEPMLEQLTAESDTESRRALLLSAIERRTTNQK